MPNSPKVSRIISATFCGSPGSALLVWRANKSIDGIFQSCVFTTVSAWLSSSLASSALLVTLVNRPCFLSSFSASSAWLTTLTLPGRASASSSDSKSFLALRRITLALSTSSSFLLVLKMAPIRRNNAAGVSAYINRAVIKIRIT